MIPKMSSTSKTIYFVPSNATSFPTNLPKRTLVPVTKTSISLLTATTSPTVGFSVALSGIIIPDAVVVASSTRLTKTLFPNG